MCHFLDMGNAKSTSSLHWHAKMYWGEEAVSAADNTKDLDGACTVLAKSGLKKNGSITEAFKQIDKEKVTYLHCQHTYTETRYVVSATCLENNVGLGPAGLKSFAGLQRASVLLQ
jgi:hypothetical protein